MAIKQKNGKYKCGYCDKEFSKIDEAETCKENHKLIYLAISTEDLHRLVQFIYSKNDTILSDKIVERLQSYLRGAFNLELKEK